MFICTQHKQCMVMIQDNINVRVIKDYSISLCLQAQIFPYSLYIVTSGTYEPLKAAKEHET